MREPGSRILSAHRSGMLVVVAVCASAAVGWVTRLALMLTLWPAGASVHPLNKGATTGTAVLTNRSRRRWRAQGSLGLGRTRDERDCRGLTGAQCKVKEESQ
jgi:hypothetical protein